MQGFVHADLRPGGRDLLVDVALVAHHGTGLLAGGGRLAVAGRAVGVVDIHRLLLGGVLQAHEFGGHVFFVGQMAGGAVLAFLGQGLGVLLVQIDHRGPFQAAELLEAVDADDVGPGLVRILGGAGRTVAADEGRKHQCRGDRHEGYGPERQRSFLCHKRCPCFVWEARAGDCRRLPWRMTSRSRAGMAWTSAIWDILVGPRPWCLASPNTARRANWFFLGVICAIPSFCSAREQVVC